MSRSHINFNALADDGWLVTLYHFFFFFLRIDDKQMEDLWGYIQYNPVCLIMITIWRKKGGILLADWNAAQPRSLCFFFQALFEQV